MTTVNQTRYISKGAKENLQRRGPINKNLNVASNWLKESRITCDNRLLYFAFSNDSFYVSLSYLPNEAELSLQKEQQHNQRSDEWH